MVTLFILGKSIKNNSFEKNILKKSLFLYLLFISFIGCQNNANKKEKNSHQNHSSEASSPSKKTLSPHKFAMALVDDAHIHIDYSSPSVRGRMIFGGLLAYGEVWQSGAHNATWLETNKDLVINGNFLKAGKYGFFTIPNQQQWTIILNKNWEQHGKDDYNEQEDVLRFEVIPEISEDITEQLVYRVQRTSDKEGLITLSWEKITVKIPFSIAN